MLFVQAAKVIMMRPHRWPDFSFGDWLARAAERMQRNILGVALANKLARMAWSVLHHGSNRVEAEGSRSIARPYLPAGDLTEKRQVRRNSPHHQRAPDIERRPSVRSPEHRSKESCRIP